MSRLDGALAAAAAADADLTAALEAAASGLDGGEGSLLLASLMGNAAGVGDVPAHPPAGARDTANRQRLADRLDADRDLVARLEERLGRAVSWDEQVQILAETKEAEGRIEAMASVEDAVRRPDRQLLLLDPTSGEQFRAAVANGDLDTADHIGVFTPGFTSTVTESSRVDDPQLTALGHSYGSTTTGYALQEESGVDRAVVFGSPGLGANTLDDIDVPDGEFYRVEARRDAVADLATFGIDPTHVNDVVGLSAQESEVDGQTLAESTGHSAYLRDDTTSQHDMAVMVGGTDEGRLVTDDGRGIGDWLTWTPNFLE